MVRRIMVAGLGGLSGLAVWYILIAHSDLARQPRLYMYSLAGCVLVCGTLCLVLGEVLRIVPSPEQVDKNARPVSILFPDDRDRK